MQEPHRSRGDRKLLAFGLIGTVVTALCCFTPLLVVLIGTLGLLALKGWLDFVLLPTLAGFIALTAYALWRNQGRANQEDGP
jgi:mercuric ion transport protein